MPEIWMCPECGETYSNDEINELPEIELDIPDAECYGWQCEGECGEALIMAIEGEKLDMESAIKQGGGNE
jgi:hypothetical protein